MRVSFGSLPGHDGRANEDFIAATAGAVVLLDGAGTPAGSSSGCSHGVAWFAHQLGLHTLEAITPSAELSVALRDGIQQTAELHADTCDLEDPGSPSSTVVVVREREATIEYLVLGDSVLLLDRDQGLTVVTDDRLEHLASNHRPQRERRTADAATRTGAERRYVEKLWEYRNREGGYWVASTDPAAADQALTGSTPADQIRRLALLSDGASRLIDLFHLTTWKDAMSVLATKGPCALLDQVRNAEHSDRDGQRWPRGKCHDDATAAFVVPA